MALLLQLDHVVLGAVEGTGAIPNYLGLFGGCFQIAWSICYVAVPNVLYCRYILIHRYFWWQITVTDSRLYSLTWYTSNAKSSTMIYVTPAVCELRTCKAFLPRHACLYLLSIPHQASLRHAVQVTTNIRSPPQSYSSPHHFPTTASPPAKSASPHTPRTQTPPHTPPTPPHPSTTPAY